MASFPWWTSREFELLVALYDRAGTRPPHEAFEVLSDALRALGEESEREATRRAAAHPSYRSVNAVATQFKWVVELADESPEAVRAPKRLLATWDAYREEPARIRWVAESTMQLLARPEVPFQIAISADQQALQAFLGDLHAALEDFVRDSGRLLHPVLQDELMLAWAQLEKRGDLKAAIDTLGVDDPRLEADLQRVGLTGPELRLKLNPFARYLENWRGDRAISSLRRALRRADVVLGSLSKLLGPLDAFKEFKESTELAIDETFGADGPLVLAPA